MRIGMILDAPFPPDIRVEKEAKSLDEAGHKIFVLCQHRKSSPFEEQAEHYTIVRFSTKDHPFLKKITADFKKITFLDLVWKKGIDRFVREYHIEALHVHDLPLVKTAHAVARKYGISVIADYHENFPAHVLAVSDTNPTLKRRFYQSYRRWSRYEENISKKVDRIIVVAEEYKHHLIDEHEIPERKLTIVQNTVDIEQFQSGADIKKRLTPSSDFIISYIGSYGPHRGLDIVIRALPEILAHISTANLIIIGRGKNRKDLENLATKLNVEDCVSFLAWMDYNNLINEFLRAAVGVIPHHPSEHTDTTIPNKLFEYMYFKIPVIVSNRPPLKRIIEETGAGKVFESENSSDFAAKILGIYRNPDDYGEMGKRAVTKKYNWNIDGGRLVELYESL